MSRLFYPQGMHMKRILSTALAATAAMGLFLALASERTVAADHNDPPTIAGTAEDIGDFFAWHTGTGADQKLIMVFTFAGPVAPVAGQAGTYDPDVLYGVHIDNDDGDALANNDIWVRFAQNDLGEWGMQVQGVPGTTGPLVGAVETTITEGDVSVRAGLFDDPFFFDLSGFVETLNTQTLSFDSANDDFAGSNITAVVIETPYAAAQGGAGPVLNLWATAARIGS